MSGDGSRIILRPNGGLVYIATWDNVAQTYTNVISTLQSTPIYDGGNNEANLAMSTDGSRIAYGCTATYGYANWNGTNYSTWIQIPELDNILKCGGTLNEDGNVLLINANQPLCLNFNTTTNVFLSPINIPSTTISDMNVNFANIFLLAPNTSMLYWTRSINPEYMYSTDIQITQTGLPCFKEDSKILCLVDGVEKEMLVQDIRNGVLVKTSLKGYLPVCMIGTSKINNPDNQDRFVDRLYLCSKDKYPELNEDLVITGCHAILVDDFKEGQREKTMEQFGRIFITDQKYRLIACIDDRATPYGVEGKFNIY